MIIGIDASRAFVDDRTGTENYSYHVITEMLKLPESKTHTFILFIRPNVKLPKEFDGYSNIIVKIINYRYLWTQLGLAWETWKNPHMEVLWIPAHTLPVLRKFNLKTVVTIHGLEYQWLKEYKNLLQRWYLPLSTYYAAKKASGLIAVSNFTAKQLQKEVHIDTKCINVIYEGVTTQQFTSRESRDIVERKFKIQDKKFILFVGSIQPRKNLVALIEAFSIFSRTDSEIKLVIAGGLGWFAEEIFQAPTKFNIQEKVVFTGRINDAELNELYSKALIYVQPSITEGFGLPVLEAMQNGLAVISSDGGALREVVGDAGIIIHLNDRFVSVLAKTMENMCENVVMRKKMSMLAKKRVGEFTWSKTAKKTLSYLLDIGHRVN